MPRLSVFALALTLAACTDADPRPAADAPQDVPDTVPVVTPIPADTTTDEWAVGTGGAGPFRFGTPLSELRTHIDKPPDSAEDCTVVTPAHAPDSLMAMLESNRLVRIDVIGGTTPTTAGVRIGDTEAAVRAAYPGVQARTHKYVAQHRYLVAMPDAPADTLRRIVFETDGARVLRYRAGVFPAVEYVEVCG